jgi:uncharacterized Zn finger protein
MAGARFYERGDEYFTHGRVEKITESQGVVKGTVRGTRSYHVKLWLEDDEVVYSCTCPVGTDDLFCKHCVAVGLACLSKETVKAHASSRTTKRAATMDDVRAYLDREDKAVLINLLMERAQEDERLRERLFMKTAKKGRQGLNVATFRRAIDRAVDGGGFVDYYSAYAFSQGIQEVIDSIADLLKEGYAADVVELSEYALQGVEKSLNAMDDSDGYMGGILDRLQNLHHEACTQSQPDQEDLAKRLFEWELRAEWDTFHGAAGIYADVLGEKGLAVYRTFAEKVWEQIPQLNPGDSDRFTDSQRFHLTHIMETLAKQSGDIEALVAVKAKDLSSAYSFLAIADIYKQAGKDVLALEWAERGIQAFPERTDSRLREFLAQAYHQRNRHDEAISLIWKEFSEHPCLEKYQLLKTHADMVHQWPAWREKAFLVIRDHIDKAKQADKQQRWRWEPQPNHSELVRIFLWENEVDTAWREAKDGGCSNALWSELAAKREQDHPADAVWVYQNQIEPTLGRKNNQAYQEAINLLKSIYRLMRKLDRREEFDIYVACIAGAHKPKRNFMKLLNSQKWMQ